MTVDDLEGHDGEPEEAAALCWTVSRCVHNPFLCLLLIIFQIVLALAIYLRWGASYAALSLIFLTVALLPFYGVYRYVLDDDRVRAYGLLYSAEHSWTEFSGWRVYEDEVRLVFRKRWGRSVLVLYAPGRVEQVLIEVQRRLPPESPEDQRL